MGKRKYGGDKAETSKKAKKEEPVENSGNDDPESEQPHTEESGGNEAPSVPNRHGFDIKHFRKELAAKQGQTMVLTQFLQVCLNPDNREDYLLQYLKVGGNSHEILCQISQDNKKNLTLATPAFHLFHLIILKVQSSMPHLISVTEEACRYFLNTFMPTVEIMISENSGPRHRKIILKLLTSMVTLNPDLGIEVLNQAPLTPKHLQYITEKVNYKEKDNVRTAFVHFMTSFLVDGHLPLIKALLDKQGLLPLVIPGLIQDEAEAVLMFLNILKKNVIDNTFISKSLKLKTFSHQVLHNLFKLFSWKGPPELSNESRNVVRPEIMSLLSDIVTTLFTSHRLGLYFLDPSLGTADANKNQNLYKALLTLKRPWENEHECEAILNIVHKCPDLHRAVMTVVEQSFEPQHSAIWERVTTFVIKLLDKLKPEEMVPRMANLPSNQVANFVRFMTLPIPLLKFMQTSLGKDHTVSLYCIKVLVKMLQTLRRYMQILEMKDTQHIVDVKNRLEYFVPKHLPTPSLIVGLIQNVIENKHTQEVSKDYKLPQVDDTTALISLIDLLLLYNDIHPAFFETLEGSIDMKKLLDFSSTLTDGNTSVLKFKVVSLWLTIDSTAISLKNPMFKDLFHIMLEVYTNDEEDTWIEAKDTLHKFFKNTSIFEGDEDEIHLVLYTLRNSKVQPTSLIGDIVEYILSNNKVLTDYVRNYIVHFEESDESSEANLNKLFDDLMENRNTQDSVFLENKVPSPFIVGCLQYILNNRDVKKNMKHFLSLYVANLLHSNYSPALTDVLIGDLKLDIRNYVASWTSQPVSLPEPVVERDTTLKDMAKSIIDDEDISLQDIFPCIQEISKEEEGDFIINDISFRINVTRDMDSSELLIWSKYLIFCTVRLSQMKMLTEQQQNKIARYFECILQIGLKHHLIDTCRSIILFLFKNPHVVKTYTVLDLGKDESRIIATGFLLQVLKKHEDIVNYLDRKYKLFKPYQQKNYNEIVKALGKISKRKNINTEHTTKLLHNIGLSQEEDTKVLNQIFATDKRACIKDDKEPSLVLELLRVLIEKYAKSICLEPQPEVLWKSMKLYTELLTNKEVTSNLTNMENAFVEFFENKPHHIGSITEEHFKKFFNANTIRKSTSQLAAILLKLNHKFCNVFKKQLSRPEILAQRELTLPLGNALLQHNQFLIENKELLITIFGEYKSNILKLLEKPHKAGQVYTTCWNFVRKLIIECMDLEECEKFFTKNHKIETIEMCHVHLMQTIFLKLCVIGKSPKKDHLINYFLNTLNLITNALKEGKEVDTIKEIVANIYTVTEASKHVKGFDIDAKAEFKKLTDSGVWQTFCKAVLKDSLRIKTASQGSTCGPQLLHLLTTLVKLVYPEDDEGTQTLFDMVTSHSEFLNVMLSHHSSEIKSRLVEFIYVLVTKNKSLMKSQQIPVYLSAYHATRSPCDRMILTILHFYESNGLPVNDYKPYVFGDSAANHYAVRKNRAASLWAHPSANQVLNLFEKDIIERTVRNFPVTERLDYVYELPPNVDAPKWTEFEKMFEDGLFKAHPIKDNERAIENFKLKLKYECVLTELKTRDLTNVSHSEEDEAVYDPVFLFSLLGHLLAPGSAASCFKILRMGLLSVPVMALASHCPRMRAAAYHVLHRFWMLHQTDTRHKNDKLFLTDFINTLRQSLSTAIIAEHEVVENLRNPRIPAVDALYLAKALMVSTAPMDPLYKLVNNFFIAKEIVDLTVVPDFLSLFHDSDVEAVERRLWILDIIKNGTKTMTDVNVLFKTMCLKMIMDFCCTVLCDRKTQEKTISTISSIVSIPRACEILVEGYGLISWLDYFVRQLKKEDRANVKSVLRLLETMLRSMTIYAFAKNLSLVGNNGKPIEFMEFKVNKDVEHEIAIILYSLHAKIDSTEIEEMASYIRIYTLLSKRVVKLLTKKQLLNLTSRISEFYKENEGIKLLTKAVTENDASLLRSNNLQTEECLLNDLSAVVKTYLSRLKQSGAGSSLASQLSCPVLAYSRMRSCTCNCPDHLTGSAGSTGKHLE
ncbi:nucleolar pre-ribosomal-associated protein 1 domain-containing protein [Phthorimaea operculella]|nr:nucleolar pre-ribosomal-associated protein 1 domain-containing protein [Phthorimaea operculella]